MVEGLSNDLKLSGKAWSSDYYPEIKCNYQSELYKYQMFIYLFFRDKLNGNKVFVARQSMLT